MSTLSVEHSPAGLDSISEIPFVPAAIRPPEGASSIAFSSLELSFINITLFPGPGIDSSSLFFVEFEFPHVVISSREVQFPLTFELSVVEVAVDDFMGVFEEADAFAVGTVDLCLSDVDYLIVLEELRGVEGGLHAQHQRRTVFDHQQLLQLELDVAEFSPHEGSLVIEIVEVVLGLLEHLFFGGFVYLEFGTHAADEQIESLVHLFDRLELASLNLLERIFSEEDGLTVCVQFILLTDVGLYNGGVALVEVGEDLQQFFIGFVDAADQVREFVFFEVLAECSETVFHEFVNLN